MIQPEERIHELLKAIRMLTSLVIFSLLAMIFLLLAFLFEDDWINFFKSFQLHRKSIELLAEKRPSDIFWTAPDLNAVKDASLKEQITYGKELVAHTARYLGPKGSVMQITNGMNCQNCHLDAGSKIFGNNYSAVASTYPKFRPRSGTLEDIYKRVNDCMERSLNGSALDTMSKEMKAIKAYITFLGSNVAKGDKPNGSGLKDIAYLDREADPLKGRQVYIAKCLSCHMHDGQGQLTEDGIEYKYPPLWGAHSYNDGAGLFRLSTFTKYVRYNMPFGATHRNSTLTDEEAWDVAAFINSQDRPKMDTPHDWPDISKKPVDHPFGPYADTFSEKQHKFGPFKPILDAQKITSQTAHK